MKRFLLIASMSVVLSGCELLEWKDRLLSTVVDQIPLSFEESIGDQLLPSILPPDMVLNDPEAKASLEALLKPLTSGVNEPAIKIHISKDPNLNAFATPGGHLIFNRGMLLAVESAEEIQGVAAHEIAHATERHAMRSMVQGLSLFAIVAFFFGDLEGLAAYLLHQGQVLLQNGFSREQEKAADDKGFDRLVAAKLNPRGMIRFFERVQKESGRRGSKLESFLSTHPLTEARIQHIEQRLKQLPAAQSRGFLSSSFDLPRFQKSLGD